MNHKQHLAWLILLLAYSGGCSCTPPSSLPPASPSVANALFDSIQREEIEKATELLLKDPQAFSAGDAPYIFQLSEEDFAALSSTQKGEVQAKTIAVVGQVKTFIRAMLDQAEQLAADGKQEEAEQYYHAIRSFGQSLNTHDHLKIFQQMGAAFEEVAKSKILQINTN